jgi:AcrR family transcriptional regulator
MSRNADRRTALADAGIGVLSSDGSRGLTHRAVDARAGVPIGTTSNYFRSRDELLQGLVVRIGERLAPDPTVLDDLAGRPPGPALFADYMRYLVERMTNERDATLALFELRLEAARRPAVERLVGGWLRDSFRRDTRFNDDAGLPAGPVELALFHYAMSGLLFDRLTTSIDPDTPTDDVVDLLVARVLGPTSPPAT